MRFAGAPDGAGRVFGIKMRYRRIQLARYNALPGWWTLALFYRATGKSTTRYKTILYLLSRENAWWRAMLR